VSGVATEGAGGEKLHRRLLIDVQGLPGSGGVTAQELWSRLDRARRLARRVFVQFHHEALQREITEVVAEAIERWPDQIGVRLYGGDGGGPMWSWLDGLERVRHLSVEASGAISFDALARFTELRSLLLGETLSTKPSLECVASMPRLEDLKIDGHSRGAEALADLTRLAALRLWTVRDNAFFERIGDHPRLEVVTINFGAIRDLRPLSSLKTLKAVELDRISRLESEHLTPLRDCHELIELSLMHLPRVERLPDFDRSARLERLDLYGLARLQTIINLQGLNRLQMLNLAEAGPADGKLAEVAGLSSLWHLSVGDRFLDEEIQRAVSAFHGRSFMYRNEYLLGSRDERLGIDPSRFIWP
jgi:hypothetical protein